MQKGFSGDRTYSGTVCNMIPERYIEILLKFAGLPTFPVACLYLLMVACGHPWRSISKPLSLKMVMVVYNFLCVLLSCIAFIAFAYGSYDAWTFFDMKHNKYVKFGCWLYMTSKVVELTDTLFMILRHKGQQISFLHVYHHFSILLLGDYAYRYAPWPPIGVVLGLNSMVHVVMYAYYGCAAYYSNPFLHWKKVVTWMQIVQFILGLVHTCMGYMFYRFCVYGIFYSASMLGLFTNFYYQAYLRPRRTKNEGTNKSD